ncbi:uncharacterized protein UV8b_03314 [Ustilaginoidea virens]|uniref:Uncharacterized protein n=1 Tax=Ustilaginoidea virens TaxID=1159556 RepID=A0A8E5HPM0_USTVR|nr:uncharacterized protein UV8b_03314 [Ustilaginoidea virens]QUC19073.1 hypothetical protein UV8b_03314 [Ustilaginoidea virens]
MDSDYADADRMSNKFNVANSMLNRTPPNEYLPPSPPRTNERKQPKEITSVEELRQRYWSDWKNSKVDDPKEVYQIPISKHLDPLQHLEEFERIFRRFDCYPRYIRVRMPSAIHELVIRALESEYALQQSQLGGEWLNILSCGSTTLFLDSGRESRDPDIQFRRQSEIYPRVIIEAAFTQTKKSLENLAYDYILKSDGQIGRVYGILLKPLGKPSAVIEWRARVTPSDDPDYDEDVRVEKSFYKKFRAEDGSLVNPDERLFIELDEFGIEGEDVKQSVLSIPFRSLYNALVRAEGMRFRREMYAETRPPAKRRRIERTPSPVEELSSAEEDADEVKDLDFVPSSDESSE